jgi:hypothetical protein
MDDHYSEDELLRERPWINWETTYDLEAWIDKYNRDLQYLIKDRKTSGHGICFLLDPDGEIYIHTTPEGEVLIDVPPEAEWIAPLLAAVMGSGPPASQIWVLQMEKLTQLIIGLGGLTKATRMVLDHDFRSKKKF